MQIRTLHSCRNLLLQPSSSRRAPHPLVLGLATRTTGRAQMANFGSLFTTTSVFAWITAFRPFLLLFSVMALRRDHRAAQCSRVAYRRARSMNRTVFCIADAVFPLFWLSQYACVLPEATRNVVGTPQSAFIFSHHVTQCAHV